MYLHFTRPYRNRCSQFMTIAALAVCLSGCVTKTVERNTAIDRMSQIAIAPERQCTAQELRSALAARESGYYYPLQCR